MGRTGLLEAKKNETRKGLRWRGMGCSKDGREGWGPERWCLRLSTGSCSQWDKRVQELKWGEVPAPQHLCGHSQSGGLSMGST